MLGVVTVRSAARRSIDAEIPVQHGRARVLSGLRATNTGLLQLSLTVGAGAGGGAIAFRWLITAFTRRLSGHADYSAAGHAANPLVPGSSRTAVCCRYRPVSAVAARRAVSASVSVARSGPASPGRAGAGRRTGRPGASLACTGSTPCSRSRSYCSISSGRSRRSRSSARLATRSASGSGRQARACRVDEVTTAAVLADRRRERRRRLAEPDLDFRAFCHAKRMPTSSRPQLERAWEA